MKNIILLCIIKVGVNISYSLLQEQLDTLPPVKKIIISVSIVLTDCFAEFILNYFLKNFRKRKKPKPVKYNYLNSSYHYKVIIPKGGYVLTRH